LPYGGTSEEEGEEGEEIPRRANCKQQHDDGVLSRTAVPLTVTLYHDAASEEVQEINDLLPGSVKNYLTGRLS